MRPLPLLRRRLALSLALACPAVPGCDASSGGARIESVSPDPVATGGRLVVHGRGFGDLPAPGDGVALDGRPLEIAAWHPESVEARVDRDQRGGAAFLVVRAQGTDLPPFGVRVGGSVRPRPSDAPDGFAGADADAGEVFDARPPLPDGRLPDATLEGARAEFLPDAPGVRGTRLEGRPSPPGELLLDVVADGAAWGVAFHLTWDPNLLSLVSATPTSGLGEGGRGVLWRTLEPGRLAFGGRMPADGGPLLSLRFALIGTGEGRIELPVRFATARATGNVPLSTREWGWTGGTLRSREDAP